MSLATSGAEGAALKFSADAAAREPETGPLTNTAIWPRLGPQARNGFQEVWYLKFNDPAAQKALWLRFTLMSSGNGFHRITETWAIAFHRKENREVSRLALKQTHDITAFSGTGSPEEGIRIAGCELSGHHTRGAIQSKGHSVKWDLRIESGRRSSFNLVPDSLARAGIVKNTAATVGEDLRFSGTTEIDGEKHEWTAAPGMQGHLSGPKNGHSWVWGHCNAFLDEQGKPAPFVFEGLCARARLAGKVASPRLSSFYFAYQGRDYHFNSLWDAIRSRSQNTLTEWDFHAERGDLKFKGHAQAEHRDFAGVTYEDTDGSLLYCANSKLSRMQIHVYRRGKLEATFTAPGTAAFEVVSRQKNPYVPLLL